MDGVLEIKFFKTHKNHAQPENLDKRSVSPWTFHTGANDYCPYPKLQKSKPRTDISAIATDNNVARLSCFSFLMHRKGTPIKTPLITHTFILRMNAKC